MTTKLHVNSHDLSPCSISTATADFSSNRPALRAWLKRMGNDSAVVNRATKGEILQAIRDQKLLLAGITAEPAPVQPALLDETPQQPQQQEIQTMAQATQAKGNQAEIAAQLAAVLSSLKTGAELDEGRVIELIQQHSNAAPVQRYSLNGAETAEITGAHKNLPQLVEWLALGVPVYLVGPAGSGKSTLGKQAAQALGLDFYEYGAIMTKYDLDNRMTLAGEVVHSAFYKWYKHGGVLLLDEMDAAQPAALVQWNNAIRGPAGTVATFSNGEAVEKHTNARTIAAANTVGGGANSQFVGRNRLDKATLDGFVYLPIGYDRNVLKTLSRGFPEWLNICDAFMGATQSLSLDHVISPRAVDFGSRLLSVTAPEKQAYQKAAAAAIKKGLDADTWYALCDKAARSCDLINRYDLASV